MYFKSFILVLLSVLLTINASISFSVVFSKNLRVIVPCKSNTNETTYSVYKWLSHPQMGDSFCSYNISEDIRSLVSAIYSSECYHIDINNELSSSYMTFLVMKNDEDIFNLNSDNYEFEKVNRSFCSGESYIEFLEDGSNKKMLYFNFAANRVGCDDFSEVFFNNNEETFFYASVINNKAFILYLNIDLVRNNNKRFSFSFCKEGQKVCKDYEGNIESFLSNTEFDDKCLFGYADKDVSEAIDKFNYEPKVFLYTDYVARDTKAVLIYPYKEEMHVNVRKAEMVELEVRSGNYLNVVPVCCHISESDNTKEFINDGTMCLYSLMNRHYKKGYRYQAKITLKNKGENFKSISSNTIIFKEYKEYKEYKKVFIDLKEEDGYKQMWLHSISQACDMWLFVSDAEGKCLDESTSPSIISYHQNSHNGNTSRAGLDGLSVTGTADKKESVERSKKNNSKNEYVVNTDLKEISSNNLLEMKVSYKNETKSTISMGIDLSGAHGCQHYSNELNINNPIDRYTISLSKAKDIYEKLKSDLITMASKETWPIFYSFYDQCTRVKKYISEFQIDTTHFTHTNSEKPSSIYCEFLNNGGTKAVFKCIFEESAFALAIPTTIIEFGKWPLVFQEIELTNELRQLGYPVMPYHKIVPICIHQLTIPGIIMPLFSLLNGVILDRNYSPPYIDGLFLRRESSGELIEFRKINSIDVFIDVGQTFLKQTARLIQEKYFTPPDAINLHLLENGCLELFIFDLYGMKKKESIGAEDYLYYATMLMTSLNNSLDRRSANCFAELKEYEKNFYYLNESLKQRIVEELKKFVLLEEKRALE